MERNLLSHWLARVQLDACRRLLQLGICPLRSFEDTSAASTRITEETEPVSSLILVGMTSEIQEERLTFSPPII
jgi:hypothetical protein